MVKISYFRTTFENRVSLNSIWYRGRVARLSSAKAATAVRICSVPPKLSLMGSFYFKMLSQQEKDFLRYWEVNRLSKKRFLRQFSIGLPLGVLIVVAIFFNLLSGWYKKADMLVRSNSSVIPVVMIALTITAVFITIFSSRHKWEQNEQRYLELKKKLEREA